MADISFTSSDVKYLTGSNSLLTRKYSAGEGILAGDFVILDSANQWKKGDVNDGGAPDESSGQNGYGIALHASELDQPLSVVTGSGAEIDFGGGLVQGELYIGSANVGKIAPVGDLATGWYGVILGYAKNTTVLVTNFLRIPFTHP